MDSCDDTGSVTPSDSHRALPKVGLHGAALSEEAVMEVRSLPYIAQHHGRTPKAGGAESARVRACDNRSVRRARCNKSRWPQHHVKNTRGAHAEGHFLLAF